MATTDRPPTGRTPAPPPWTTGRHRRGETAVPQQRSGSASSTPAAPGASFPVPASGVAVPPSTGPDDPALETTDTAPPATSTVTAAESRGRTEIAEQVVQKIAAAALGEIEEIGGPARRILGVGSGDPGHRPRVTATVHGTDVDLQVRASVRRPAPVPDVVERARARVTARIAETTALHVRRLDVTVTALPSASTPAGRIVR